MMQEPVIGRCPKCGHALLNGHKCCEQDELKKELDLRERLLIANLLFVNQPE